MARNFDVMETININGSETKSPFLIGVAGGTASGKVYRYIDFFYIKYVWVSPRLDIPETNHLSVPIESLIYYDKLSRIFSILYHKSKDKSLHFHIYYEFSNTYLDHIEFKKYCSCAHGINKKVLFPSDCKRNRRNFLKLK